jgi:Pentapeptide repeats (8 copies)
MVLRFDLTEEHRQKLITSLVQFPLFSSADRPGNVSFKHELLAEYLFGRQLAKAIGSDPVRTVSKLVSNPNFCETLAFRYLVQRIHSADEVRKKIIERIVRDPPPDRVLKILLQLWLSSAGPAVQQLPTGDFLEGRDLSGMKFVMVDLSGRSFRSANLTDVRFSQCALVGARFEGARLVGTRFERLHAYALRGAQFGNIENFEYIYAGTRLIEDREVMRRWTQEHTGIVEPGGDPCPTNLQVRELFGKYVYGDGSGRRDELPYNALTRGRTHRGAPTAADRISACIRHAFLHAPNYRSRVRRASGAGYNEIVGFMQNWQFGAGLRAMIDELCPIGGCNHIP